MKKIIISVTSDLVTDQRVHKVSQSCTEHGYHVILVGRRKNDSLQLEVRDYKTVRFKLWFEKGALFYANYNLRLFVYLLFHKSDVLISNDLDTLLPNFLVSKLKGIPLLYDNHEYYTGVPELKHRPFIRSIWKGIEKFIFSKLKYIYTVNDSIKELYEMEYKVPVSVVRNIPVCIANEQIDIQLDLPKGEKIILYQGAGINKDRGVEELVEAMQYVKGAILLIVGSGDVIEELKAKTINLKLGHKIRFEGKVPFKILKAYTQQADLGLTIDKDTNINYRYSLPNKLFDYIQAGVPVLSSRLVEIEKIITHYNIGCFIENHTPKHIAEQIEYALSDNGRIMDWKENLKRASKELCWQNEEKVFLQMLSNL